MSCCRAVLTITLTSCPEQVWKRGEWCVSIAWWPCFSYPGTCASQHCLSPAPPQRSKRLCPFLHRCSILLNLSFSLLPGEALPKSVIPQNAHSMQNTQCCSLLSCGSCAVPVYESSAKEMFSSLDGAVSCVVLRNSVGCRDAVTSLFSSLVRNF